MVQKEVLRNSDRCIHRIQESGLDFYLIIPSFPKVSLVLALMDLVTDDKVISISKMQDKVVMVPVLDEKILFGIKQNQANYFDYLDKYVSNVFNLSHRILVHNRLEVFPMIYFYSDNNYQNFREWFVSRHINRVQKFDIMLEERVPVVQESSEQIQALVQDNTSEAESINVDNSVKDSLPLEVFDKKDEVVPTDVKEPGFVSYVLLGVIIAVLSLVFLYIIL